MSTYLHIADGAHGLLVDIAHVLEVADVGDRSGDSAGRRNWREHHLAVVDLGAALGAPARAARQQVILRDGAGGEAAWALDVERVLDLVDVDERRLQPLQGLSDALTRLVDAAWPTGDGHCLLRLRTPFAWSVADTANTTGATRP